MSKPKKKQISLETIESIQLTINDLLESSMDQASKKRLCIIMEKLSKDMKLKHDDYQYLWWNKYGKQEWEEVKEKHLQSLSVGDKINQGDIIGTVGSTGRSTGPHLDFRVNWFQTRLDPMSVIN